MKGSLGINIILFFSRYYLLILFYMVVHDPMCDKMISNKTAHKILATLLIHISLKPKWRTLIGYLFPLI